MNSSTSFNFIAEHAERLANVLISEQQIHCLKVAALLEKLLQQRERTIDTLTHQANSEFLFYRKLVIAKTIGNFLGTGGKIAVGTGLLLGHTSRETVLVGRVAWAVGLTVAIVTLGVEYWLSSGAVTRVNCAIAQDQDCVDQLIETWDVSKCMLGPVSPCGAREDAASQYAYVVSDRYVHYRPQANMVDPYTSRNFISLDTWSTWLEAGAVLVGADIIVLLINIIILSTNKEQPAAAAIKDKVDVLKVERDRLQSFYQALHRCLSEQNNSHYS